MGRGHEASLRRGRCLVSKRNFLLGRCKWLERTEAGWNGMSRAGVRPGVCVDAVQCLRCAITVPVCPLSCLSVVVPVSPAARGVHVRPGSGQLRAHTRWGQGGRGKVPGGGARSLGASGLGCWCPRCFPLSNSPCSPSSCGKDSGSGSGGPPGHGRLWGPELAPVVWGRARPGGIGEPGTGGAGAVGWARGRAAGVPCRFLSFVAGSRACMRGVSGVARPAPGELVCGARAWAEAAEQGQGLGEGRVPLLSGWKDPPPHASWTHS